jgi:hypothetical protein
MWRWYMLVIQMREAIGENGGWEVRRVFEVKG